MLYHSESTASRPASGGRIRVRFATVEGSSLEEKLSFLALHRERGLGCCEEFTREVGEAMERERRRRASCPSIGNASGHGSQTAPDSTSSCTSESPQCMSPFDADAACNSTLAPHTPSRTYGKAPSNAVVPCQSYRRRISMDSIPELQQLRRGWPEMAEFQHQDSHGSLNGPALEMRMPSSDVQGTHTGSSNGAAGAADAISPSWLADLRYYECISPAGSHLRSSSSSSGKAMIRAAARAADRRPSQQQRRRDASGACLREGGHPTTGCHHGPRSDIHEKEALPEGPTAWQAHSNRKAKSS